MHSITLNQNWKKVRVTLDPPQKGPSRKGKKPTVYLSIRSVFRAFMVASLYSLYQVYKLAYTAMVRVPFLFHERDKETLTVLVSLTKEEH